MSRVHASLPPGALGLALAIALGCVRTALAAPLTFVVSDLHFGVGKDADEEWDAFEDFRWHDDFDRFLDGLRELSPEGATLVLNGDTFELWQSPRWVDPERAAQYVCLLLPDHEDVGCSESTSLARLERILADSDHEGALKRLRDFAEKDRNRVVIVPGNHDAALLYPSVRERLRKVIGERIEIAEAGHWLTDDRRTLVEHGHQMDPLNEMKGWAAPFTPHEGALHLVRPWGESFVLLMFDPRERDYPIVDNIGDHAAGIDYLLDGESRAAGDGPSGVIARLKQLHGGAGQFLRFLLFQTTRSQFGDLLSRTTAAEDADSEALGALTAAAKPDWDVDAIRRANDPALLRALLPHEGQQADAIKLLADWAIIEGKGLGEFDPDEIRVLCSAQWERDRGMQDARFCPTKNNLSQQALRAAQQRVLSSPNKVLAKYLTARSQELFARDGGFDVYVYSHTHKATYACSPVADESNAWRPIVINTGAWQRTASRAYVDGKLAAAKAKGAADGTPDDPFAAFAAKPEDLAQCYGVVALNPTHPREPKVLFWTGRKFEQSCPQDRCLLSSRASCKLDEIESVHEIRPADAVCR